MSGHTIPTVNPGAKPHHGTVTTSPAGAAVALGASQNFPGGMIIQNNGASDVWLGGSGVNGSNGGTKVVPGASVAFPADDPANVYAYSAGACPVDWNGFR